MSGTKNQGCLHFHFRHFVWTSAASSQTERNKVRVRWKNQPGGFGLVLLCQPAVKASSNPQHRACIVANGRLLYQLRLKLLRCLPFFTLTRNTLSYASSHLTPAEIAVFFYLEILLHTPKILCQVHSCLKLIGMAKCKSLCEAECSNFCAL